MVKLIIIGLVYLIIAAFLAYLFGSARRLGRPKRRVF